METPAVDRYLQFDKSSSINIVKEFRERLYRSYVQAGGKSTAPESLAGLEPRGPLFRQVIHRHFPADRGANIIDLGCGHGAFLYFARQLGYRNVTGVDRSSEQVAAAKRLGIEGVQEGDLQATLRSLPDDSQDVVIAFDVIEHFTKVELFAFADETYRVLRPDGQWIIHTPNGESPLFGRMRYGDFTHELAFTHVSITQLLKASGFSRVHCFEDAPIPHGIKSTARWLLWKIIRLRLRSYLAVETGELGRDAIFSQNILAVAAK